MPAPIARALKRIGVVPVRFAPYEGLDRAAFYDELVVFLDALEDTFKEDTIAVAGVDRLRLLLPSTHRRRGVKP